MSQRDNEAIRGLKDGIAEGRNWCMALLEAVRLWSSPEEDYKGRHYQYLVDNEAFDWLVLTERLCEELDGLVPEEERTNLVFSGIPPVELSKDQFKSLIGPSKYRAHLNYFYGILVERFLLLSVTEEIRKKKTVLGVNNDNGVVDGAYQRIYGATKSTLLKQFRKERDYPQLRSMRLSELSEFTYWLFKYRMKTRDKSLVASDTKKGLTKLHELLDLKARSAYSSPLEG
ncbi:MAG: hypothetical protein AMJ70_03175 [Dehalococcoidia bacterium SG8_51_3]|nr:MAG: hypothetical protein AMJ70_03175 [Dehalococcoidia bacterium SG8_51_3]